MMQTLPRIITLVAYAGLYVQVRDLGATRELLHHHLNDLDDILSALRSRNGVPAFSELSDPCQHGAHHRVMLQANSCSVVWQFEHMLAIEIMNL